ISNRQNRPVGDERANHRYHHWRDRDPPRNATPAKIPGFIPGQQAGNALAERSGEKPDRACPRGFHRNQTRELDQGGCQVERVAQFGDCCVVGRELCRLRPSSFHLRESRERCKTKYELLRVVPGADMRQFMAEGHLELISTEECKCGFRYKNSRLAHADERERRGSATRAESGCMTRGLKRACAFEPASDNPRSPNLGGDHTIGAVSDQQEGGGAKRQGQRARPFVSGTRF